MLIFFYGLFMDEELLGAKGLAPAKVGSGFVEDFALRIGERATLVPMAGSRAYGVTMELTPQEAAELYSEESVSDYVAEIVAVTLSDGREVKATCYNLPSDRVVGINRSYAESLLKLARALGFPESYLQQISEAPFEAM